MNLKKKLQTDKENLAKDLASFEDLKTTERKKIEEEKRRLKRPPPQPPLFTLSLPAQINSLLYSAVNWV